jgi:hypothetical protein
MPPPNFNMHQQYLQQFMPGMPPPQQQQHHQHGMPPPPPHQQQQYANWQQGAGGNSMPNPQHFQHQEHMHNIPGATPNSQYQKQPETFGGHGGKYVPRLWPKQGGENFGKGDDAATIKPNLINHPFFFIFK